MFNNVRVGAKLIAGFLCVAAIAAFIGIIGILDSKKLDKFVDELYTKRLVSLSAVDDISLYLSNIRVAVRTMPAADDQDFRDQIDDIERNKIRIEEKLAVLDEALTNERGRDLKRQLSAEYRNFLEFVDKVIEISEMHRVTLDSEYRQVLNDTRGPGMNASRLAQELVTLSENMAKEAWESSSKTYNDITQILITLVTVGVVTGILLGVFISRSISVPLKKTIEMLEDLKKGRLGTRLCMKRGDEIGHMARTMDSFAEDLQNVVIGTMKQIAAGDLSANVVQNDPEDEITPALHDTIEALRGLIIDDGGRVLEAAANRDLAQRLTKEYRGEYAKMKEYINQLMDNLDMAMHQVADAAKQVSGASGEISEGAQSLAEGANEQASSLEEVSSSLEEMSSMTKQNANNSSQAKALVTEASDSIYEADGEMKRMAEAITQIKESSDNTAKILKTIDDIAFQTNLLALNAAVEAARAGEAGKGFAVVAEEVRNLAMRSAEAARNTAEMIGESVKNADSGVQITKDVAKALEKTVERAGKVSDLINEIAAASNEQSQGVEQINTAVAQMNHVTQQNAANSEESASAAEELSSQATELENMVGTFRLSGAHGYAGGTLKIAHQSPKQQTKVHMAVFTSADRRVSGTMPAVSSARATRAMRAVRSEDAIPLDDDEQIEF